MTNYDQLRRRLGCRVLFDDQDIASSVRWASEIGFKAIEINLNDPRYFPERLDLPTRKEVRRISEDLGVALLFHAPEDLCLASMQKRMREAGLARLKEALDLASDVGGKCVTFHLGVGQVYWRLDDNLVSLHDKYPEEVRGILRDTVAVIREHRTDGVAPCIENAGYFGPAVVQEVLAETLRSDGVYLTWDIAHAHLRSRQNERQNEFFLRHLESVRNAHIHDNDGSQDRHGLPGTGTVDFAYHLKILSDTSAFLILEIGPRENAVEALRRIERYGSAVA